MRIKGNVLLMKNSYINAFDRFPHLANEILVSHNVPLSRKWGSLEDIIHALTTTEEKVGSATLKKIGKNIPRFTSPDRTTKNFDEFLTEYLNPLYEANHQNINNGFMVRNTNEGYYVDLSNNPYPFTFNHGLLEGFCIQFQYPARVIEVDNNILFIKKI